ncbi:MAG: hypothetical protein K8T26_16395 [Lentisphaerae bacterium]|nr:hypothetical protein [Lentisphaerota bacterium]
MSRVMGGSNGWGGGGRVSRWLVSMGCAMSLLVLAAGAQAPAPAAGALGEGEIETSADRLNYDRDKGIVEGVGHVVIRRDDVVLRADYVRVDVNTQEAEAFGDVTLTRGDDTWKGPSLRYNFKSGAGATSEMKVTAEPFYVRSDSSERDAKGTYILHNAWVSTCNPDEGDVDFHVTARELEVVPDDYIKARGAVWWFGPVPSMYIPYWYRDLDGDFGFRFQPGYSSRNGPYMLSSYRYRLNPGLTGSTHLDYRTERGVATGQDFRWNTGEDRHVGDFKAYYADDQDPLDDQDVAAAKDIEADRYRLRYHDTYVLAERDIVLARAHYLSDPDVLEDFFEDEFRDERQPDNFVNYTHRGDQYTAGIVARSRVNDFYDNINRLPEATYDLFRQPLGDTDLFYESESAASVLEHVFPDGSDSEDYNVFRFDTKHTLFYPDKYLGFLTVVPRAGVRATYFSDTVRNETVSDGSVVLVTNRVVDASGRTNTVVQSSTSTNAVTRSFSDGADTRALVELGFETSYKAFQVYDTRFGPRRHIVEPFANYTFIPEPNVTPDHLYQFDEVDTLDEQHTVRFGARQKWQEKRPNGAYDLVDLELSSILNIHQAEGQDAIEFLYWDGELRPVDGWAIDTDGSWSLAEGTFETFNTWLIFNGSKDINTRAEYRYRRDDSSALFGDVTLFPEARWSYNAYAREEFEQNRLEEVGGYIQHTFTCVALRVGSNFLPGYTRTDDSEVDDEYRFMLEFWLTAFPKNALGSRHGG